MFRVIIAGGRDFDDYQLLKATMDKLLCNITDEITVVVDRPRALIRWVNSMPWRRDTPLTITPPSGSYTASELDTYAMSRWHRTQTLWPHSGTVKAVVPRI